MAASKGLNPQAPAYIPLSYTTKTPFTNFPPLPIRIRHLPFPFPPPQPSFFPTASQPPLFHPQPPLYTTSHGPIDAPPPPAVEAPPVVRSVDPQTVRIGAPSRRPRVVTRCSTRGTRGFRSSKRYQKLPPLLDCEEKTTVMIKNIPKLYNGELLLKFLDEHCLLENQKRNEDSEEDHTVSAFDFMYLPIDFRTGCSRGFGFVNFTEARAVWKFFRACNGESWDLFQSPKIREIVCARIQGKEALVKHFEKSRFHCESDEFLPVCFNPPRDGSGTELVEETRIGRRMASNTQNV